ncbi:restriction endonuclease subunit S [Listeria weihenstephanensis]|uniref:Restriction endonuclease subunit S n=1 Tax=Listeria weihenstephanensis TaxID=1006155 RepID=A0A841Z2Z4_9LIST|nr:restriction endonuclease subunit S [Listeria weihenstephanensis]MBC1499289.1 restriction endonuclease subunit S [Listeria weihenstephanensis]
MLYQAWEQRKLGEIVNRLNKTSNSSQLPKIEFEDIIAGEGRLNKNITSKFDGRKGILFKPNNILYGKLRPYLKNWLFPKFEGIALGDFWVFEAKDTIPSFIYNLIQSDSYQKIANDTSGTKMPRSDWKKVSNSDFLVPKEKIEQQKIGSFFQQFDHTIALHQRKLDALKLMKQGFLQQMFPVNGKKVPKVRFVDFDDDWEQFMLGKLVQITMGQSPKSINYTDNPSDYILVQGNADMRNGQVVPRVWTKQATRTADIGDIILSVRAPVGDVGKTDYHVALGHGVAGIKGNEFIYQILLKMKIDKYWVEYSVGSTFESINSNDLKEAPISVPNEREQKKVGAFFSQLDETIALDQKKLDKLNILKKAYLKNMFI